jgi:hypothetical protein
VNNQGPSLESRLEILSFFLGDKIRLCSSPSFLLADNRPDLQSWICMYEDSIPLPGGQPAMLSMPINPSLLERSSIDRARYK